MAEQTTPRGVVAEGFEAVRDVFEATIAAERPRYAAQLVAYVGDKQVVDLWAGPDIRGDSLLGVFSSTKGAAFLTVALLVQDGLLDLDQEVRYYWPEFGVEGKEHVTVRELLTHQAGLIGVDGGFSAEELIDDRAIAARLATQRPFWRPGSAFGYHAVVIGALAGELVHRITGETLQQVYETRIRAPYDLDFFLGLPEEHEPRVLDILPMEPTPEQRAELEAAAAGPHSFNGIAFNRNHPEPVGLDYISNTRASRAAGQASAGGVATARGLAGMYAAAISTVEGRAPLLKPETIAKFSQVHSLGYNVVFGAHGAFALGFQALGEKYRFLGARAFGHSGAAGSLAFADPSTGLAYGYTRRSFAFPGGAAPENDQLAAAIATAVSKQA